MDLFRISRTKYIEDLNGEGARKFGGRWNFKGSAVLYTSQSESLAALETLVHAPISTLPNDLSLLILSVPDDIKFIVTERDKLPADWRNYPAPNSLAEIGSNWIDAQSSLLLKVPSVLVQTEWNVLVNPEHSDMKEIKVKETRPFRLDMRLLKSS